jgi:hypothetical protein
MFAGITTAASTLPDALGLDLREQLLGVRRHRHALAADLHRLPRRCLIDDRHLRLPRRPRDRQADQQGDRHRVDDQHADKQARAAEDQQVLGQQRFH